MRFDGSDISERLNIHHDDPDPGDVNQPSARASRSADEDPSEDDDDEEEGDE